ncbi:MAG: hypothetical protein ACO3A4_02190 [Silvanigrellaceae bacterium]
MANAAVGQDKSANKEKAIAFSRPEQVLEILREVNRRKTQVLIKYSNDGKLVRGVVEDLLSSEGSLVVSGISAAGDELLAPYRLVRIEFILLSKKIIFVTKIKQRIPGKILLALPDKLVALERRANARFRVPIPCAAFLEFVDRKIELERFDAPFVPRFLRDEVASAPRVRIDDVSLGGVACFTRYGAVADLFRADEDELNAHLYLPSTAPLPVRVSVRWTKKTTAAVLSGSFDDFQRIIATRLKVLPSSDDMQMRENFFRIGFQFTEVTSELDASLRAFIKLVQTAESV